MTTPTFETPWSDRELTSLAEQQNAFTHEAASPPGVAGTDLPRRPRPDAQSGPQAYSNGG